MDSFASKNIRHQRNIVALMAAMPIVVMLAVCALFYFSNNVKTQAQVSTGPSLLYLDDGKNAQLDGATKPLVYDIRYNGQNGTITASNSGVTYTSYPDAERTEQYIGSHNHPLWSDNSSGWFAFDFKVYDTDSSWRVIEQEHEGDASPSRSLEAFQGGSSSQVKICSRYGSPNTNGCAKSWTFNSAVGKRIQIIGYEKFGQGTAVMQAWWRPYGQTSWTQFANSSNFSMGYTSGNPGRYHKRGTYHGNHAEQSSVTWYATAVMFPNRSEVETAVGFSDNTTPPPEPVPPAPAPAPSPLPSPQPTPNPDPAPETSSPDLYVEIPGANETKPVKIPDDLPVRPDGTIIADIDGDGLNDLAEDNNNDGKIDPQSEIVVQGVEDSNLTFPQTFPESKNMELVNDMSPGVIRIKAGPLPEVKVAKPVAYTFLMAQVLALSAISSYLAITKLAIFSGLKSRWGL